MKKTPTTGGEPWEHLKQYGYAPGGYLSRCFTCMQIIEFMDKRAICCRPCAEAKHAAAAIGNKLEKSE